MSASARCHGTSADVRPSIMCPATCVSQCNIMRETHGTETRQLSLHSSELSGKFEEVQSSLATARVQLAETAQHLADCTSQRRAVQRKLTQHTAETKQLRLDKDSLSSSLSQLTIRLKTLQAAHCTCADALKACTANKEAAEHQVQQQQAHIASMDCNLAEARRSSWTRRQRL